MNYKRWLLIAVILVCSCACTYRTRTPSVVPEWGRAGLLGISSRAKSISLVTGDSASKVIAAWPARDEANQDYIHLYILDAYGSIRYDADLQPSIIGLDEIKLVTGEAGELHLYWMTGLQDARVLWSAVIPSIPSGQKILSLNPIQISQPDPPVVWFEPYPWEIDQDLILWLDDDGNAFVKLGSSTHKHLILQNVLALDANQVEEDNLAVAWTSMRDAAYIDIKTAILDIVEMQLHESQLVSSVRIPQGARMDYVGDLMLNLQGNKWMVSWTQPYDYGGRAAKQLVVTPFFAYPGNTARKVDSLSYPFERRFPPGLTYDSITEMHIVQRSQNSTTASNVRGANSSAIVPETGIVIAASVQYRTRTRETYQPTLVYVNEKGFIGHQPLTWTDHPSMHPIVISDDDGYLYAAWIDNAGVGFHYPVYLATTQPDIQRRYKFLNYKDLGVIGWDWLNRIVLGIVLFPYIIQWFLLPIGYLVLFLIRGERYGKRGNFLLLGGLFIYWASKYVITPQVLTLLPDIGIRYYSVRQMLPSFVPLLTLSASMVGEAVNIRVKRRWDEAIFGRFLRIALPDAVLSIAIYAIGSFS